LEDGAFTRCIDVNNIDLQPGHYFGFTAATGTTPPHLTRTTAHTTPHRACLNVLTPARQQASLPTTMTFTVLSCAAWIPRASPRICPSYVPPQPSPQRSHYWPLTHSLTRPLISWAVRRGQQRGPCAEPGAARARRVEEAAPDPLGQALLWRPYRGQALGDRNVRP